MRLKHLTEFISQHDPDIICLQELKCETNKFPYTELEHLPYNFYVHGQKSYNGVAILSKQPSDEIITDFPGNTLSDESRFIAASFDSPIGYIKVISLYAPNGGEVKHEKYEKKLVFYDNLIQYLSNQNKLNEKIFIGADYNIAPFDIDVYDPATLESSLCFSYLERRKLRTLFNIGFVDNYRVIHPQSHEFSWWDYRAGHFQQNKGMRIDSIISSSNAISFLSDCIIDYVSRSKEKPSDHAPVIAIYDI
ncbi:MAG: exodeoxyribonuclease III [Rickettsiaceae bacterium]|nr:exodeoxyribonuclease III [Rickettsiaceae bacterium]